MKKLWMILPALACLAVGVCMPKVNQKNDYVKIAETGPVYEVTVDSLAELKEVLSVEEDSLITIESDIAISETLYTGKADYTIVANKDVILSRAEEMTGDLFYVSKDSSLTVGDSVHEIVIDGNKSLVSNATGSIFDNRGTLNLSGVSVKNVVAETHGIVLYNSGDSNLENVKIFDNSIEVGQIYGIIYTTTGSNLVINKSEVYNNVAKSSSGAAIFANTGSNAWIYDSKFYENVSGTRGGMIAAKGCNLTVRNSKIYANEADYGGAIHSYDGAVVNVSGTEFYENVAKSMGAAISSVGASISLTSVNAHENRAKNKGGVVYVESSQTYPVTVSINGGVFAKNTALNEAGSSGYGGAVYVKGEYSQVNIFGANFSENRAVYGGAVDIDGANAMIAGGTVSENTACNEANSTGLGGGLYFTNGSQSTIHDVKISGNYAQFKGGAINITGETNLVMYGAKLYNNEARYGAGVGIENGNFVQESGEIMYNVSSASGCGVFVDKGSYTLNDGQLSFNKTTGANGGGINNKDKVYINGGTIEGNSATWYGGAIHSYISDTSDDVQVVITGGTFKDNGKALTIDGESATVGEAAIYGGGAININSGILKISGGTFVGNAAAQTSSSKYGFGGAVSLQGGKAYISGGTFSANSAQSTGGALHLQSGEAVISGGTFTENTSVIGGGAVFAVGVPISIKNATFTKNTVTGSGANGGAVHFDSIVGDAKVEDSRFSENTSQSYAGALYTTKSEVVVDDCEFTKNYAKSGAGAVGIYEAGTLTINSAVFSENDATAEADGVRGKDVYVWGNKKDTSTAKAIINGGSYENLGVHYGKMSFGGDVSISDKAMTWAGVAAYNVNFIIHDELKNPITLFCRYVISTDALSQKYFVLIDNKAKKNIHKLIGNVLIDDSKTFNYYIDCNEETEELTIKTAGYKISTPGDLAVAVQKGANQDEVVTIKVLNGYEISNLKYNGIEIVADQNGEYSFTMPAENVEITYDYQLSPVAIKVDDNAKGLLVVDNAAPLYSRVEVALAESTGWVVDNVYYLVAGEKVYLDCRQGKYYFTMFEGVELFVEKTQLYYISFADNKLLSTEESYIKVDGKEVVSTLAGDLVEVEFAANDYKYLADLENSYYTIEGDETRHSIKQLQFEMPNANVVIHTVFVNIYADLENIVEVDSFAKLKQTLTAGVDADIILTEDVEVSETIQLSKNTNFTIVAFGNRTIKRAVGFANTMFVLPEFTTLTLGLESIPEGMECQLVVDGNATVVKNAVGSLFAVINSSELIVNNFVKLTNNKIEKNEFGTIISKVSSNAGGGAIMNYSGKFIMNGGEISNNSAKGYGGAIYSRGYVEINDGKITNNTSTLHGGAIYSNRVLRINGGEISYNILSTADANGAGVYAANDHLSIVTISGGKFVGNESKASAGALYVGTRATMTIYNAEFVENKSTTANAGAIYLYGKATIYNATFRGNYAKSNGGAVYINSGDTVNVDGQLYLKGGLFDANRADYGGGAIAVHRRATLDMQETTAVFTNNTSKERGGAIYILSDSDADPAKAIVLGGRFENNTSANGNDVAVQYGVLEVGGSVSQLQVKTVANPSANRGHIKIVKNLENKLTFMPISYEFESPDGSKVVRMGEGVSVENVLKMIEIPQPSKTTYQLIYAGNNVFDLRQKDFLIAVADGLEKAISVVPNANSGEEVSIKVNAGYEVSNLKYNGIEIVGNKFKMPSADVEITFTVKLIEYAVTVKTADNGTVVASKTTATVEDVVTVAITPEKGFFLKEMIVNGVAVEVEGNLATITVDKDTTISATFEKTKYTVCYNYNYNNKIEIKTVEAGSLIKEIQPTRKGYEFAGWFTDKELSEEYDFEEEVYGVVQLYAKWIEK